jgi:hypothetical protein
VNGDDVGVAQHGGRLRFAAKAHAMHRVALVGREKLDRHFSAEVAVENLEHDTHPAATEHAPDLEPQR